MKSLFEAYQQMKEAAAADVCPKCKKNPCQCDSVEEELKGGQVKLDKNKNGKLESDDFKKLRKEDAVPFDGPYTKSKGTVTDKSGAKHTGMSRARDLARKALDNTQKKYAASKDNLKKQHFGMAEQFTEGYEEIKVHSKDGKHIGTITHGKYQSVAYAHPTTKFGGSKVPHPDEDSTTLAGPHETQKGIDYIHAHHRMMSEELEINEGTADDLGNKIDNATSDDHAKSIISKAKTKHLQYLHHWNMGLSGARTHKDMPHIKAELSKRGAMLSAKDSEKHFAEEVEHLDELSPKTLGSYVKKAAVDSTISRKIASDFEHMASRAKKPSMKASASELEKEYKSKSWKRRDNIGKAVDRLTKEEVELDEAADNNPNHGRMTFAYTDQVGPHTDVDHLHVKQVGIGARAQAGKGANMHLANYVSSKGGDGHKETSEKFKHVIRSAYNSSGGDPKKVLAAIKAHDPGRSSRWSLHSHIKEEQMKTYSDLISQLDEYNSKEGVYRHKGKYGTSHDDPGVKSSPFWHDTEKDEDDEKPKKAAAPAVKRGRGRPAGAKSGARQQGSGSGSDYSGIAHHSLNLPNSNK